LCKKLLAIIQFVFFTNYFVGVLAVALSLETLFQLRLPLNSWAYYVLLFSATVVYYTFAYTQAKPISYGKYVNPRIRWYENHHQFIGISQQVLLSVYFISLGYLVWEHHPSILRLPLYYWVLVLIMILAALLYYGFPFPQFSSVNLRSTGLLKPLVIGFVWSTTVTILPIIVVKIESGVIFPDKALVSWFFMKNWMLCSVNAIMFDLKDYASDANKDLKTLVVRIGLRKTIFLVIIPLLVIGIISLLAFAWTRHFHAVRIMLNLVPFVCTLLVAYSLHLRKPILFYLIVIDGILLLKAICGIVGMQFAPYM
jgi:hypothetical protein